MVLARDGIEVDVERAILCVKIITKRQDIAWLVNFAASDHEGHALVKHIQDGESSLTGCVLYTSVVSYEHINYRIEWNVGQATYGANISVGLHQGG